MAAADQWRNTDEWVTIPEAAGRMRIQERQARRLAAKLPEVDRTTSEVRPAKVRWAAICPADVSAVRQNSDMSGPTVDTDYTSAPDHAPIAPDHAVIPPSDMSELSGQCPSEVSEVRENVRTGPDAQYEALAATLEVLRDQLAEKDRQLAEKDRQIAQFQTAAENEQKLRAGELQQRAAPALLEAPPPTGWIANIWNAIRSKK